jgi:DNA-binding winged helix-turn-helix (wHTH) protein
MKPEHHLFFPPFHLDLVNETLWCGARPVPLRPKALAVLRYLVEHAQRLVTQEELLKAVWQRPYVSEGLLRGYIRELRGVLGDEAQAPRFIETASRRGYRFIASVTTTPEVLSGGGQVEPAFRAPSAGHPWVGRAEALARLQGYLERAWGGVRQVVFITGEAGIGKTTLVNAFLERAREAHGLWVLEGQCVEHYGAGEALLPLLEALGRRCRLSGGEERLMGALRRYAPTWLLQLPWLVSPEEREALKQELFGATQQRLLSEVLRTSDANGLLFGSKVFRLHSSIAASTALMSSATCKRPTLRLSCRWSAADAKPAIRAVPVEPTSLSRKSAAAGPPIS